VLLPNGNDCWIEENDRGLSVDPSLAWATLGRRLNARKAKSPQDGLPTQQRKTPWIYAEKTELGTDLFPPATELFCKVGSASASKTPQRTREEIETRRMTGRDKANRDLIEEAGLSYVT
jgi:hypothetical protein